MINIIKVAYISHYTGLYGANKSLLEVIINMKTKYGIKPIVITPGIGEFSKKLDGLNIENYSFKYYQWMNNKENNKTKSLIKLLRYKLYNRIATIKISNLLKNKDIDLIHTNSTVIDIGANISKKIKVKHIWHLREFGEEDYNLIPYKKFNKACTFIEENSDKIICISAILRDKYKKQINNKNKWKLIYNGIRVEDYFNDILNKEYNKDFVILFTGFITKSKNQMELLKAVEIVINKKNRKDIRLYYLGDGDQDYINEMKQFCDENKLDNNVFFEGRVENIKEYIKKSHIGVICSKKEAFGRVTVEYMMGGLAVIASNTGANPEIINNNIDGVIYEFGNYEDLSCKIEELYINRSKLKSLSLNGQKKAIDKFTSDINCKNIYEIYKQVMKSNE